MRHTELKAKLEDLVDRTGRVEDMLKILSGIYRERARHPEYADPRLHKQMRATAHALHEASDVIAMIFEDFECEKDFERVLSEMPAQYGDVEGNNVGEHYSDLLQEDLEENIDVSPNLRETRKNPRVNGRKPSERKVSYLPLNSVLKHVPAMQRDDVSVVARSPRGCWTAYRRAGGNPDALSDYWDTRRAGFIARHMAQVRKRGEPLFDEAGEPTRRHLALIAWAYSPSPAKL